MSKIFGGGSVPDFALPSDSDLTETPSGLKIQTIDEGSGKQPGPTDQVEVHYAGWLLSGKLFDSSYGRGQTITFGLNQVIPGWTEGLQHMKEGGKSKLVIPADLAYGSRGAPPAIGPNETLLFQVELIQVK